MNVSLHNIYSHYKSTVSILKLSLNALHTLDETSILNFTDFSGFNLITEECMQRKSLLWLPMYLYQITFEYNEQRGKQNLWAWFNNDFFLLRDVSLEALLRAYRFAPATRILFPPHVTYHEARGLASLETRFWSETAPNSQCSSGHQ